MLREYPEPKDFESFLYVSQVLQAEGIKIGAEHLRRIMPHNMGSLFWQLNDCWPVASWSSIDYTGRWKALQYYARRFYRDLLVSPYKDNGNINVFVVSDRRQPVAAELKLTLLDFDGRSLWSKQKPIEVASLDSKSYFTVSVDTLLAGKNPKNSVLVTELLVGGKTVSRNEHFFLPFKDLALSSPQFSTDVPGRAGFFTENYLSIVPGQKVEVLFRTEAPIPLSYFRAELKIRSLTDAF
jgi:beta-mannosidase